MRRETKFPHTDIAGDGLRNAQQIDGKRYARPFVTQTVTRPGVINKLRNARRWLGSGRIVARRCRFRLTSRKRRYRQGKHYCYSDYCRRLPHCNPPICDPMIGARPLAAKLRPKCRRRKMVGAQLCSLTKRVPAATAAAGGSRPPIHRRAAAFAPSRGAAQPVRPAFHCRAKRSRCRAKRRRTGPAKADRG